MTDLRAILGAKYDDTIEKVAGAIAGDPNYLGCGCCTGYDYDEAVKRTGHEERTNMAAHDALAAVLPDLLAAAFDEGRRLGLHQADYEMGAALNMPDLSNPYRQDSEGTEAGA